MLRFFAKLERSRNIVLLLFCLLLLIGLVAFYIPNTDLTGSGRIASSSSDDNVVIAKVGSQEITAKQFRDAMNAYGSQFSRGNPLPLSTLKALGTDKQALDGLIASKLALDIARDLGLSGTDREVGDQVMRTFVNPDTNQFIGKDEYLRRLALNGQNATEYENQLRESLSSQKVRDFLIAGEQVSAKEIEENYKKENTKVDVAYAIIDRDKVKDKFKPVDADLQGFYNQHKDEFKADEPTRKVDYIFVSTDQIAKNMTVTDAELKTEWEGNKQKEFRASVIRRDVLSTNDEGTVKAKIDELNTRVRGTPSNPKGEDFATVAKGDSQDPSAKNGGDIGFIRKDPNKPGAWRQRVFSLKVGDVDGPFRDGSSWYILKVTEERDVPFADMKPTLRAGVANRKAFKIATDLASKAYEKATEAKDLRKGAEAIAADMKQAPEAMLKSTPYFKNGDTLPDIGSNPAFEDGVKDLKKGDIGDKIGIPGGQAVPMVTDVLDKGAALSFEQARNQVENKLRQEKEPNIALARAQEIASKAKSVDEFKALCKAEGFEVKEDTNFNNLTFPGQAGSGLQSSVVARNALLSLKEGETVKAPIKYGAAGYLVFIAAKRTEADLSKLATARDDLRQRLVGERQNVAYDAYLKAARKRYEDAGKLKIYQDRIDKLIEASSAQ